MFKKLIIATRKSPLAIWQANFVRNLIRKHHSDINVELLSLSTQGDQILDTPLAKVGGKGLFIKELETAMLEGKAHLAVHSMKDLPMVLPDKFSVIACLERHNQFDAFVSNKYFSLAELPKKSVIGTSSLRRKLQLQYHFPYLQFKDLRGNIGTRINKLDMGEYDAIILAASGLERMGQSNKVKQILPIDICLPAITQGTLAIESYNILPEFKQIKKMFVNKIACKKTNLLASAERAMGKILDGGCQTPIAGFAKWINANKPHVTMVGMVVNKTATKVIKSRLTYEVNNHNDAITLGENIAHDLIAKGAKQILAEFYKQ